ncbi:MAG: lasso peptide biosynthesis B2 protein [Gemmatimonadales bacterium]
MIRRLTPSWRLAASGAGLALAPMVHLMSLERATQWLARRWRRPADGTVDDEALVDWVDRFLAALPWPWRRTCLKRGLTLYALLQRSGRPADLVVGVRRSATGALEAHAWLERETRPVFEPASNDVTTYREITRFRGDHAA